MTGVLQDFRYAGRRLAKSPGFTLTAALTLALGIGANTAIFSLVKAVMIDPLPYPESDRLAVLWEDASHIGFPTNNYSPANYYDVKERNSTFEDIAACSWTVYNLTGAGEPREVRATETTGNFFGVLGVQPLIGRVYGEEDEGPEAEPVVVLSYSLWQTAFGGAAGIVGSDILLDGRKRTVLGVMPRRFAYPGSEIELYTPVRWGPSRRQSRGAHFLHTVGRLADGVSFEQARADLDTVWGGLAADYPAQNQNLSSVLLTLHEQFFGRRSQTYMLLLGAVGCLLLIACVNVANLLLVRASGRRTEVAVRAALGAGRGRLAGQILTESLLLAALGGVLGVILAAWSFEFLAQLIPQRTWINLSFDWGLVGYAGAVSLGTGLVFGLIPALALLKSDVARALQQSGGRSDTGAAGRKTRDALVIAEAALAGLLLIAAGLVLRSFANVRSVDLGFEADRVLAASVSLPGGKYGEPAAKSRFYRETLERIEALPNVSSAGYVTWVPMNNYGGSNSFTIEGRARLPEGSYNDANVRAVAGEYLQAMGIRLNRGRLFDARDRRDSLPVSVINQAMADKFWPGEDALGKRFKLGDYDGDDPWRTIVGIVDTVRQGRVEDAGRVQYYLPYDQAWGSWFYPRDLAVRVDGDPLSAASALRSAIWQVDPDQPVANIRAMTAVIDQNTLSRRIQMTLFGSFAGLALLLAALGVYGTLSYSVAQRTREMGLRLALGAERLDVIALVLGKALKLALTGLAIGCVAALAAGRLLESVLYEVNATDGAVYAAVIALISLAAAAAGLLPGRRAAGVEPMTALRHE